MSSSRHYPNAPITEAIIDLRVNPRADLQIPELRRLLSTEEKGRYPKIDTTFQATGTLQIEAGVSASASAAQEQTGFKFTSVDGKYVWQSRRDGFTLGRLTPYESWESFRDEAKRLWDTYREAVQPAAVTRLAVRYINRIDVPSGAVNLKQFFRTSPEISPDLPQQLAGFFMQLRIPDDALNALLIINQTVVPPARDGVVSVALDIDLFRSEDIPNDEDGIWEYFEALHTRKNEVFESCITDKTRELFQ